MTDREDDTRPSLLLLSGLLCDEVAWDDVREALGPVEARAIAFPGFDSIAAMAESVLAAAPPRFALAGHSMGGRVALAIIAEAPERVERLALLNTGVHPRRPGEAEKRQELVDLAYSAGMAAVAERWLPPMLAPRRVDAAQRKCRSCRRQRQRHLDKESCRVATRERVVLIKLGILKQRICVMPP